MKIILSNTSKTPIYEQISTQIKESILKGILSPGDALPSIRALGKELKVSVITTKRAYEELEREGYIATRPGKGSFVSSHNMEDLKEKKLKVIEEKLEVLIEESKALGLSSEELKEMIDCYYE